MPNYIVVHKPSQLIKNVITSSALPTPDNEHSFHEASIIVLNHYYKLHKKAHLKGVRVSVGDLMNACPSFMDQVSNGPVSKVQLVSTRIRNELTPAVVDRESSIKSWIHQNPTADVHDLSGMFLTGTVVATAYINKYR